MFRPAVFLALGATAVVAAFFSAYIFIGRLWPSFANQLLSDSLASNTALGTGRGFLSESSLQVNGEITDFSTEPPEEVVIHPTHPRLMFRSADVAEIRTRFDSARYAQITRRITGRTARDPSLAAFMWQIREDRDGLELAKQALLRGTVDKWGFPFDDTQWVFVWAVTYDWIAESLSAKEKAVAWSRFVEKLPRDSIIRGLIDDHEIPPFRINNNNHWGRRTAIYEIVAALAIFGDGIADDLSLSILEMVHAQDPRLPNPWATVDWGNLMALDSGGCQMSHDVSNLSGYCGFFALPVLLLTGVWSTATEESLWEVSNFFRYLPLWSVYDNDWPIKKSGISVMQVLAGRYHSVDPSMSALAIWYAERYPSDGKSRALDIPVLVWGDHSIEAKSPRELGFPLHRYLRGADAWVSRSSWRDDATVVNLASRTLDFLRYEPAPGTLSIYASGAPILTDSRKGKWARRPFSTSGVNIGNWPQNRAGVNFASMYRKPPLIWRGEAGRAQAPREVAEHPAYFANTLEAAEGHWATVRYEHLRGTGEISLARRSVVHLEPYVVVFDEWETTSSMKAHVNWRLSSIPSISRNGWVWDGASATVLSESLDQLSWLGGEGNELLSPSGEWAGAGKGGYVRGYSSDPDRARRFGIGSIYASTTGSARMITVIEIDGKKPPAVEATDEGWGLTLGELRITAEDGHIDIYPRPEPR